MTPGFSSNLNGSFDEKNFTKNKGLNLEIWFYLQKKYFIKLLQVFLDASRDF
jgi:hypothetical protein